MFLFGVQVHEKLGDDALTSTTHPLVLLSHGCMYEKRRDGDVLLACRVRTFVRMSANDIGNVRAGGVKHTMYLGEVPTIGEAFADFRYAYRVLRDDLVAANHAGRRVASMTVDGRVDLQVHLFRFFTRRLPLEDLPPDPEDV